MNDPNHDRLPSWKPGETRDAIERFLDAAEELTPESRVACFDNDGTLWCERPTYVQAAFLTATLKRALESDPKLKERPEVAAVVSGDEQRIRELGMARVVGAVIGLYDGQTPERFRDEVRAFMETAGHPTLGRPLASLTYRPMQELMDELRRRGFTVAITTGGGTEFVRALCASSYRVPPELVVGTMIEYRAERTEAGAIEMKRTASIVGVPNEGPAKVQNIQMQLGRRPILAAGNSTGDREMLEWATSGGGPGLALLLDHDDDEREFSYRGHAETVEEREPIDQVARNAGWTIVSMRNDWSQVFAG